MPLNALTFRSEFMTFTLNEQQNKRFLSNLTETTVIFTNYWFLFIFKSELPKFLNHIIITSSTSNPLFVKGRIQTSGQFKLSDK